MICHNQLRQQISKQQNKNCINNMQRRAQQYQSQQGHYSSQQGQPQQSQQGQYPQQGQQYQQGQYQSQQSQQGQYQLQQSQQGLYPSQQGQYRLSKQQVAELYEQKRLVDVDINENIAEIRMLNNKMAKNDYDVTYLNKLKERERILNNKQKEFQEMLLSHQYLQEQINISRVNQQNFRTTLADEYRKNIDDKKTKKQQEKRRQVESQQKMIQYNQMIFQTEQKRRRSELQYNKRTALEELAAKERAKQREKQQKQYQKQEYNKKVNMRNNLESQKEAIYKQYYSHFVNNQNRLQSVYNEKTAPDVKGRQKQRNQFERKEQEEFTRAQKRQQEDKIHRINYQRDMLKTYLQSQMNQKELKKSIQLEQRRSFNQQAYQHQIGLKDLELIEKNRRKDDQRRYDEDLAGQIRLKQQLYPQNQTQAHRMHNPITNPIDFKMGITNPYVINQYQQTKQRFVGDKDLKMRNLATVGNKSITHLS